MLYTDNGPFKHLSVMGLGCWNFGGQWNKVNEEDAIRIIRFAIDHGINFVDVAESYGIPDGQCEIILGKALQDGYREKVTLISKIGWYGRRTADHFSAVDSRWNRFGKKLYNKLYRYKDVDFSHRTPELLRLCGHACCGRLQTNYIDLLLCHDGDPKDAESFIEAFRTLKQEGFIRHYGISTDSLDALKRFYQLSNQECAACECDYSLLHRTAEDELFKFCQQHGIAIFTRGTLCRGLLSGKYDLNTIFNESSRAEWNPGGKARRLYEKYIHQIETIKSTIDGHPLAETAYRYAFSVQEHPSVVIGCTSMDQIEDNINIGSAYLDNETFCRLKSLKL